MLREDDLATLDQLNKDLRDFHNLFLWLEHNSDARPVVRKYATINDAVNTALEQVVDEIKSFKALPRSYDSDRQALKQLIILLQFILSDEQLVVMENHLFNAAGKISTSLQVTPIDTCDEETRACLTSLDRMLMEFRPH